MTLHTAERPGQGKRHFAVGWEEGEVVGLPAALHPQAARWAELGEAKESTGSGGSGGRRGPLALMQPEEAGPWGRKARIVPSDRSWHSVCRDQSEMAVF